MKKTLVLGIVNVTPDSFSDGGKYFSVEEAVRRIHRLADEGAYYVDIGAESTRPGATPISWQEEWERLAPVLTALAADPQRPRLSIDTYHPETAELALEAGVQMINCVYPEPVKAMAEGKFLSAGKAAPLSSHPPESLVVPRIGACWK